MDRLGRPALVALAPMLLSASFATADSVLSPERQLTKLGEGVYVIRHKDPFPSWVHGNTTVLRTGTRITTPATSPTWMLSRRSPSLLIPRRAT